MPVDTKEIQVEGSSLDIFDINELIHPYNLRSLSFRKLWGSLKVVLLDIYDIKELIRADNLRRTWYFV